jgi:hypothetical protein
MEERIYDFVDFTETGVKISRRLDIFFEIMYKIVMSIGSVMKAFAFVKSVWSLPQVGVVKAVVPTGSGNSEC